MSRNINKSLCALKDERNVYTAFHAVVKRAEVAAKDTDDTTTKFDGSALERIVNVAFMISTHSKLFKGMTFAEWFPYFIQQLSCFSSEEYEKIQSLLNWAVVSDSVTLQFHTPDSIAQNGLNI